MKVRRLWGTEIILTEGFILAFLLDLLKLGVYTLGPICPQTKYILYFPHRLLVKSEFYTDEPLKRTQRGIILHSILAKRLRSNERGIILDIRHFYEIQIFVSINRLASSRMLFSIHSLQLGGLTVCT